MLNGILFSTECTPEQAARIAERTLQGDFSLLSSEKLWMARYKFLEERGYTLRQRYHPDWSPSWTNTSKFPWECEDYIVPHYSNVLDATRQSDQRRVAIKVVSSNNGEIDIARYLSSGRPLDSPGYCVPILDVLPDPLDDSKALLVMPYLRPFNDPPFSTVEEVTDFIRQTLEGLVFMHSKGVAHRDCASANIMMDARPLYPKSHHAVRRRATLGGVNDAPYFSRTDKPVSYFFIDFGLSTRFEEGQQPLVTGTQGRDRSAPELSDQVPYDAHKLDVYVLGNLYFETFFMQYDDLEFLRPLFAAMVDEDPAFRASSQGALDIFTEEMKKASPTALRWRLRPKSESLHWRLVADSAALVQESLRPLRGLVGFNDI